MFEQAKWIWSKDTASTDCYTEFYQACELDGESTVLLRISADSNYAVYVNGVYVDSGQYADFPHYKIYDEINLDRYITSGKNHIAIIVWYYGVQSFNYYIGKPGVIFELRENQRIVAFSDKTILSRKSKQYISGQNVMITGQLGLSFQVNLKESSNWMLGCDTSEFDESVVQEDMPQELLPREIKKLSVGPRIPMEIVMQGGFRYSQEGESFGAKMQQSYLSLNILPDAEGTFFILDLQEETSGYVEFDLEVSEDCAMEIGWGEHLQDGRCRTQIGARDFSASVHLKQGRNSYMNPFRRLGCRYLQFFVHNSQVKIHYAGLRPTIYPVTVRSYKSDNLLRNTVYEICCNTLIQCMHEHYEDCPWREQSYYSLDSRNQMLCGYYAFEETEFPRASLRLIAKSIREDGMLPICYPTNERLVIPSFALSYMLQLAEYYRYTKDKDTVAFCYDTAKTVIDTFVKRIDDTGLIPNFDEDKKYWNFYEWQPHMNGWGNVGGEYDMCLNAWLSLALGYFIEICNIMQVDANVYLKIRDTLNQNIAQNFYDETVQLFCIRKAQKQPVYSVLANALGYLCGAAKQLHTEHIFRIILENGSGEDGIEVIPATLSMHTFRYDALLKEDKKQYKELVLDEIDRVYLRMLRAGATSFWETEKGDKDFSLAGSLCHGWSAMPIYYYKTLCEEDET